MHACLTGSLLAMVGCSQSFPSKAPRPAAAEEVATACCPVECDFDAAQLTKLKRDADSGDIAALGQLQVHYGSLCKDQPGPKYFELLEEGVRRRDTTSEINLAVELMNKGGKENCRRAEELLRAVTSRSAASKEDRDLADSWLLDLKSKQQCSAPQTEVQ